MDTIDLGGQIKKFRTEKGITMRSLALKSGITPSMLSQIEKGTANPSIQTLKTFSSVLEVPLFYFFIENTNSDNLISKKNNHKIMIINNISYELISPNSTQELETMILRIPSGATSSEAPTNHNGEEVAYILKGEVDLQLNDKLYHLSEGDSVRIPPYVNHKWANTNKENVEIIFSVTPPNF